MPADTAPFEGVNTHLTIDTWVLQGFGLQESWETLVCHGGLCALPGPLGEGRRLGVPTGRVELLTYPGPRAGYDAGGSVDPGCEALSPCSSWQFLFICLIACEYLPVDPSEGRDARRQTPCCLLREGEIERERE